MDHASLISFLVNFRLLNFEDLVDDDFKIELINTGLNYTYAINRPVGKGVAVESLKIYSWGDKGGKYLVKIKKDLNKVNDSKIFREYLLLKYLECKCGLTAKPQGIYLNNNLLVTHLLDGHKAIDLKDKTTLSLIINKVAAALRNFNVINISGKRQGIIFEYFDREIMTIYPFFIKSIPSLSSVKYQPDFYKEFWNIVHADETIKKQLNESLSIIRKEYGDANALVHGDFRVMNLLYKKPLLLDKIDIKIIDLEYWHFGSPYWDLATFIVDLELYGLNEIKKLKENFMLTYFGGCQDLEEKKNTLNHFVYLLKIQKFYFSLNAQSGLDEEKIMALLKIQYDSQ